jgi:hypothetical protein
LFSLGERHPQVSFFDSEKILNTLLKNKFYYSFGDSTILNKLASGLRNTRQNPNDKHTSHVSDPEKILKPRGFLKQSTTVYQPKSTQSRDKIPLETINDKLVLPKTKT